jgi:hypothetical protein
MSKFLTDLDTKELDSVNSFGEPEHTLLSPLVYQSDLLKTDLTVPTGFVTDFATIPRIPLVFDALGDRGDKAATVHDMLYTAPHGGYTRAQADAVLKEALIAEGVPSWMAWQFYIGVRMFGASHWD